MPASTSPSATAEIGWFARWTPNTPPRSVLSLSHPVRRKSAVHFRRRELHGFAAAAGAYLVWVVEDELRRHLVDLVVHLGTEQKQHGLRIDQYLDALVLNDLVGGTNLVRIFDGIGLAGATAVLDPDP